ncbi:MAG: hypothetical protein ACLPWF_24570 [Bryobacteraceae bacterium]
MQHNLSRAAPCRTLYDFVDDGEGGNKIDEPRRDSPVARRVSGAKMGKMAGETPPRAFI